MIVALIGSGRISGTLGRGWGEAGHEVVYGSRDPESARIAELLAVTPGARAATPSDAVAGADAVVLAVPFRVAGEVVEQLDLVGRVLIDATNPMRVSLDAPSGAAHLARHAPGARIVKAFNTTGAENMRDPRYGDEGITMFVCGDDRDAKGVASRLATDLGFEAIDAGGLANADLLENLAALWVQLAHPLGHGRDIALTLRRRPQRG